MSDVRVALDSSAAIRFMHGDAEFQRRFEAEPTVSVPTATVGELLFGALNSSRPTAELAKCEQFLSTVKILETDLGTARAYAELRLALRRAGTPIPANDAWIAATCLQRGLVLVTSDAHFRYCSGLVTEDWSAPETGT